MPMKEQPMQHATSPADLLQRYFGYDRFRGRQKEIISHVMSGQHAMVVMPTGMGKSLCYQIPALVRDGIAAMRDAVGIDVTVKSRLGVDEHDSYAFFSDFIGTVSESGCTTFIVHARKAWLSGLSPKQNREVPPLHYDRVLRLKRERPELEIILNGGITSLEGTVDWQPPAQ